MQRVQRRTARVRSIWICAVIQQDRGHFETRVYYSYQGLILYGDGNLHRHSNLPCLMAGKLGGQFETGRHLAYKLDTPMSNLLLTILLKSSVQTERIGDSTNPLEV
jgi:hypothetical protein